jgi:muramoyltetrapeptide carboxypeptidase
VKIGVFGPSSAVAPDLFNKAKSYAESLGHQVYYPIDPSSNYGNGRFLFASDSGPARMQALKELLYDPSVDLIFAARGGSGAIELVSELGVLAKEIRGKPLPRPICLSGFSDFTAVLNTLEPVSKLQLIHGAGFLDGFTYAQRSEERAQNLVNIFEISTGKWTGYQDLKLELINGELKADYIEASFIGGNLSLLSALVGSNNLVSFDSKILFLEEIGEKPHKIHKSLFQLKNAGLLEKLKGVLIGDFTNCRHEKDLGPTYLEVFSSVFKEYDYPVIFGFPAGHAENNLPLPLHRNLRLSLNSLIPIDLD